MPFEMDANEYERVLALAALIRKDPCRLFVKNDGEEQQQRLRLCYISFEAPYTLLKRSGK